MTLSIWDQPTDSPKTMPLKLKLVIGAYALFIPLEAWWISMFGNSTKSTVRIAVCVLAMVFLIRGSDRARALLRGLAAVGAIFGLILLVQLSGLGVGSWPTMTAGLALAIYAFMFWALGQDDVRRWMWTRSMPSSTPPAIASFVDGRTQ
jgi:hypothetical protein